MNISQLRAYLPSELVSMLNFTEDESNIYIKLTKFLGSDKFKDLAQTITKLGGHYDSNKSRFEISKQMLIPEKKDVQLRIAEALEGILKELEIRREYNEKRNKKK